MAASPGRITRSTSKRSVTDIFAEEPTTPTRSPKRSKSVSPTKRSSPSKTPLSPAPDYTVPVLAGPILENPVLEVPSRLNFDLEEAKAHLIKQDVRAAPSQVMLHGLTAESYRLDSKHCWNTFHASLTRRRLMNIPC